MRSAQIFETSEPNLTKNTIHAHDHEAGHQHFVSFRVLGSCRLVDRLFTQKTCSTKQEVDGLTLQISNFKSQISNLAQVAAIFGWAAAGLAGADSAGTW